MKLRMRQAVQKALDDSLASDENVIILGEDIGAAGGAFKATEGLMEKYGSLRVMDTPISEMGFLGAGVGAAIMGLKPVVEMMFIEFVGVALDQLTTQAATMRYLSRGKFSVPLVMRASASAGQGFGCQHSQTLDHWFRGTPGLKVVMPSGSRSAYGLLRAAIEDPDPVIVLEPRILYGVREEFDVDENYRQPLGKAEIIRNGEDVTLVTAGAMTSIAKAAAEICPAKIEIIDLLSIWPWDSKTIFESARKTGRIVTLEESQAASGWGGDIISKVLEQGLDFLKAPPHRITLPDAPIPYNGKLEAKYLPSPNYVSKQIAALVSTNVAPKNWWNEKL